MKSKLKAYQLALSGKKTLFKPKKATVHFIRSEDGSYSAEIINRDLDEGYPLSGLDWYHADLLGNRAMETTAPSKDGNVVLGFTSNTYLMLDIDFQEESAVIEFAIQYTNFHKLGSVLILKSSEDYLTDLFGNSLGKFLVIFGRPLGWEEIQWHITEVRRLGMIERAFTKLREFGYITIRVNAKNDKIPPPKILKFFANGDMRGIRDYVSFLNRHKDFGSKK